MDNKIIAGIIAVIVIALIAAFAFSGSTGSTERAENELVTAVSVHSGEPESGFDPLTGWGDTTEPLIQSKLLKTDANGSLVNDLATGYTVSNDLKTIDVDLRDDVKFTDDTPLNAEDVVFTFEKAKETGAIPIDNMESVTAVNDTHVQFVLNETDSTFIYKLTQMGIVPSDSYNNETYGENPVGSGPYKMVQWDKGQQTIFEVNEDYYGKKPYYTKITNLYLEPDAAFAKAQKGEIDVVQLPLSYGNQSIEGMHQVVYPSIDVRYIGLPVQNETTNEDGQIIGNNITADPAIREAISVGVNRSAMIDGAFNGLADVCAGGISPVLPFGADVKIDDGKVDEAKEILANAGWTDTDGDGIVEKDGVKASFELDYASSDSTRQAIALQFAEQVKPLGIEVTPQGKTWDEMDVTKFNIPVVWGGGNIDPMQVYKYYDSAEAANNYNNPAAYSNPQVDSLIDSAMHSTSIDAANAIWAQVPATAQADNPYIWIGTLDFLFFVTDGVDLSDATHTIYPHGGDIWGNVLDWTATNATSNDTAANETANNTTE